MTKEEAKAFVKKTLTTGNKERIIQVLNRYFAYMRQQETGELFQQAKEIFDIKT